MGLSFKKAAVPPKVNRVLQAWHKGAKKRLKLGSHVLPSETVPKNVSGTSNGSHVISVASPMASIMEESQDAIRKSSQAGSSSSITAAQNVWDRRLRKTNSGGRKAPLRPIDSQEANQAKNMTDSREDHHGEGLVVSSTPGNSNIATPGSELRRRASPKDAADLPPRPLCQTPKAPLP